MYFIHILVNCFIEYINKSANAGLQNILFLFGFMNNNLTIRWNHSNIKLFTAKKLVQMYKNQIFSFKIECRFNYKNVLTVNLIIIVNNSLFWITRILINSSFEFSLSFIFASLSQLSFFYNFSTSLTILLHQSFSFATASLVFLNYHDLLLLVTSSNSTFS